MNRFYLTTAIDYVNSRPHLGTAYEKVTADVIARYRRLRGHPTRFVMGNDEHSQNVFQRATELGLDPRVFCDRMEAVFREVWAKLDVSFDDFIRTTEARHRVAVTTLVERIAAAGDLYEGEYEGWYCVSCEAFKQDRDLVDGECPVHRSKPDWVKEKNHFFRLSRYRDRLLEHYAAHPTFVQPEVRRNEMLRLLERGLEDISVSRTGQRWGIPLPFDPSNVVYVWFDALTNYMAAVGYGSDEEQFATWWPADVHVVGKDITRFHAVVWPAMLMSAGIAPPRRVFGHGWVNWQGRRMSKSLGTNVDPLDAADRLGPDPLRLYLVKEIVYGQDGDFTWERFDERYNADLANNFGNLVSRVTAMAHKYRGGRVGGSGARRGAASGGRRGRRGAAVPRGARRLRAARGDGGGVRLDRRHQRVHHPVRAVGAGQERRPPRRARPGAVRDGGGGADCGAAAVAGNALVLRGDLAPDGPDEADCRESAGCGCGVVRGRAACRPGTAALAAARGGWFHRGIAAGAPGVAAEKGSGTTMTDDIPTTAPLPVERDPGSRRVGGPRDGTPSAPPAGGTDPGPAAAPPAPAPAAPAPPRSRASRSTTS